VIRAVLDTNALLSGIVGVEKEASTPGAIMRAWRAKQFELVKFEHIRTEHQRHLTEKIRTKMMRLMKGRAAAPTERKESMVDLA
jgi:hypothetical protein